VLIFGLLFLALAIKMLNWQPKSSLKLGLRKTIDYFKEIV
jgi:dTDP-D-glucose 4,6-dehydratase